MTISWDWNDFCHTDYLFLFFLLPQMCAKKWCVEKELASHQIKALSSCLNVNAILGGSRLTMALPKTSSFYLVWFPIVRVLSFSLKSNWIMCVCEYVTTIPHTAEEFVDELLCICITGSVAIACLIFVSFCGVCWWHQNTSVVQYGLFGKVEGILN